MLIYHQMKKRNQTKPDLSLSVSLCLSLFPYTSSPSHADSTELFDSFSCHTSLYPSLLEGLLDCIECPKRLDVCKSLLVSQHWRIHVQEPIKERRLQIRLYFIACPLLVLIVFYEWFLRQKVSGRKVECCLQDLFSVELSYIDPKYIFLQAYSERPYSSTNTATA